jgi:hypothetical protein
MMMDPSAVKQEVDLDALVAEQNWALVAVGLVALLHYLLVLGMDFGLDLQGCWMQSL